MENFVCLIFVSCLFISVSTKSMHGKNEDVDKGFTTTNSVELHERIESTISGKINTDLDNTENDKVTNCVENKDAKCADLIESEEKIIELDEELTTAEPGEEVSTAEPEEVSTAEPEEEVSNATAEPEKEVSTAEPEEEVSNATAEPEKQVSTAEPEEVSTTEACIIETTVADPSTEKPSDPCEPNPCQNGGVCKLRKSKKVECKCPKGTSGKRCERVDWCKVLKDDGKTGKSYCNRGEAKCVSHEKLRNFSCVCYNRRKEFNYEIGKCKTKDMCSPNPCKNGGICKMSGYRARCHCPKGISGRTCERINWCKVEMENGKSGDEFCNQGEARCVENRHTKNFTCICYNKRETFNEELQECISESKEKMFEYSTGNITGLAKCEQDTTGYDECRDRNALCFADPSSYFNYICVCKDGTNLEGEICENIEEDACSENSEGYKICREASAECVVNSNEILGYSCRCLNGLEFDKKHGCTDHVA